MTGRQLGIDPTIYDGTLPVYSATTPDLTLQTTAPLFDGPFLPTLALNPLPTTARRFGGTIPVQANASAYGAGRPATATSAPAAGQTPSYGALPAPADTEGELVDLRRKQAAFGDVTRKIDLQNAWFAAPVLAASALPFLPEATARWIVGEGAPEAGQTIANFVEREPYVRVGDNWATRAGRRAHAALKERLEQKPSWEYEPKLPRSGQRPLKPDAGRPNRDPLDPARRKYIELKPDSPSGRAAGARALQRYRDATQDPVRLLFYNLKDFI